MNSTLLSVTLTLLFTLVGCGALDGKSEKKSHEEYQDSSGNKCNIRDLISSTYSSDDYGDIKLNIASDNSVKGEYSYDGYEGTIEGTFDRDSLSIEGKYHEIKERKVLILPLPPSEENGSFVIKFKLTDCEQADVVESNYLEDGESEWESWGLKSK